MGGIEGGEDDEDGGERQEDLQRRDEPDDEQADADEPRREQLRVVPRLAHRHVMVDGEEQQQQQVGGEEDPRRAAEHVWQGVAQRQTLVGGDRPERAVRPRVQHEEERGCEQVGHREVPHEAVSDARAVVLQPHGGQQQQVEQERAQPERLAAVLQHHLVRRQVGVDRRVRLPPVVHRLPHRPRVHDGRHVSGEQRHHVGVSSSREKCPRGCPPSSDLTQDGTVGDCVLGAP